MRKNTRSRLIAVLAAFGLLVAGLTLVGSSPAAAATGDLTCGVVNLTITFSPPLSATQPNSTATGTGTISQCLSPNGAYSQLTSANITGTGSAAYSPPTNATIQGKAKFAWNNGQTSNFTFDVNSNVTTPKFQANITSGPLKGDTSVPTGPAVFVPNVDAPICGCIKTFTVLATVVNFA